MYDYHSPEHANAEVLKMSAAKMLLMMTLLKTKGSEWYSTVKLFSVF